MKYSSEVQTDENGEMFIIIPDDLIKELDWKEGDVLQWTIDGDTVILSRKEAEKND
jgi:bifunctional DNA-binding transcriptional regulator/antitoxin component of YhaV-PrlF toxin-antitoxin module